MLWILDDRDQYSRKVASDVNIINVHVCTVNNIMAEKERSTNPLTSFLGHCQLPQRKVSEEVGGVQQTHS